MPSDDFRIRVLPLRYPNKYYKRIQIAASKSRDKETGKQLGVEEFCKALIDSGLKGAPPDVWGEIALIEVEEKLDQKV